MTGDDLPNVVILGGGIGALTTAFQLSNGDWDHRFNSITIYQQGWRLGGKGASGRNAAHGNRIEEHGLHVWFGYYENAFRMLEACHRELDEWATHGDGWERWSTAMTHIGQGFRPISRITVMEDETGEWVPWVATFPEEDTSPWDRDLDVEPADWDVPWYLRRLVGNAVPLLRALALAAASSGSGPRIDFQLARDGDSTWSDDRIAGAIRAGVDVLDRIDPIVALLIRAAEGAATWFAKQLGTEQGEELSQRAEVVLGAMGRLLDAIRLRLSPDLERDDALRRLWVVVDLLLAILRGLIRHRVVDNDGLDELDQWDFRDWLDMHGALAESADSSLVRCLAYDLPFAYQDGDRHKARCAAGTAVRLLFRTFFTYRGALMWKMNAGMGDVVAAPLYELLVKRGVNVEFFHQVVDLELERNRVSRVKFDQQWRDDEDDERVDLRPPERPRDDDTGHLNAYKEMLTEITVIAGSRMAPRPLACWPSQPLDNERFHGPGDAEQYLGKPHRANAVLELGDDDIIVFGMSLGTIPFVADQLVQANPRWEALVAHVKTVATVALQLWLEVPLEKLGFRTDDIACGFSEPFDTFSDMPELRFQENIDDEATVVYLCSVLDDVPLPAPDNASEIDGRPDNEKPPPYPPQPPGREGDWRKLQEKRAADLYERFRRNRAGALWPAAEVEWQDDDDLRPRFDDSLLIRGPGAGPNEPQYLRANIDPSERYVLSLPGTSQYRLSPGDTGFKNLYVAGDWTRCVLNVGCVEAAAISGMLAAEAILKHELPIIGRPTGPALVVGKETEDARRVS